VSQITQEKRVWQQHVDRHTLCVIEAVEVHNGIESIDVGEKARTAESIRAKQGRKEEEYY